MKDSSMLKRLQRATLQRQGLSKMHPFGTGQEAVLRAIEHLGYIQIDTLSVVERAHHHALWTRVPNYQSEFLNQLVQEHEIFEYWFHAASYLPMKDFHFALPRMQQFKRGESHFYKNVSSESIRYVLDKIRIEGPQKARDFKSPNKKSGTWWAHKPAKLALETLFMQGDLMISGRDGMEKTYDLMERVLPSTINTSEPTPMEFAEYLVNTNLRAYGVTSVKQMTHLRTGRTLRKNIEEILRAKLEDQSVQQVKIDGTPNLFMLSNLLEGTIKKPILKVRLLSPFDNSVIHRDRLQQLFNFDYRMECYVTKAKRKYGYFSLPILYGDVFVGRVDCKAHRKSSVLELIHLHLESPRLDIEAFILPFVKAVKQFASFNGCASIKLTKVSPSKFASRLKRVLEQ